MAAAARDATSANGRAREKPVGADAAHEATSSGAGHSVSSTPTHHSPLRLPAHSGGVDRRRRLQPLPLLLEMSGWCPAAEKKWSVFTAERTTPVVAYNAGASFDMLRMVCVYSVR